VRWNKLHNAHALCTLVLKPFWELPKKQRQVHLEARITKFCFNFYTLLREQPRGLTEWRPYIRERPSSFLSPLATAPLDGAVANDTDTAANETTPADNNTKSSDPDSDDGDGEGERYNSIRTGRQVVRWNVLHTFERKGYPISEGLETNSIAKRSLAEKSAEMTYEERQEYFKLKHQQVDEKALISTQPEREAKMETKRKNREWSENSKGDRGHFPKTCETFAEGEETGCSTFG
jgi:hypothetical protein